ncbi:RNA exonuclease [Dirofilaria immitis]
MIHLIQVKFGNDCLICKYDIEGTFIGTAFRGDALLCTHTHAEKNGEVSQWCSIIADVIAFSPLSEMCGTRCIEKRGPCCAACGDSSSVFHVGVFP